MRLFLALLLLPGVAFAAELDADAWWVEEVTDPGEPLEGTFVLTEPKVVEWTTLLAPEHNAYSVRLEDAEGKAQPFGKVQAAGTYRFKVSVKKASILYFKLDLFEPRDRFIGNHTREAAAEIDLPCRERIELFAVETDEPSIRWFTFQAKTAGFVGVRISEPPIPIPGMGLQVTIFDEKEETVFAGSDAANMMGTRYLQVEPGRYTLQVQNTMKVPRHVQLLMTRYGADFVARGSRSTVTLANDARPYEAGQFEVIARASGLKLVKAFTKEQIQDELITAVTEASKGSPESDPASTSSYPLWMKLLTAFVLLGLIAAALLRGRRLAR